MDFWLLWDIVAYIFGILGFPGRSWGSRTLLFEAFTPRKFMAQGPPGYGVKAPEP